MARAAAKSRSRRAAARFARRASKEDREEPILIAAGSEIVGLVLIGLSLLATLALATYSPQDPVGELVEVANSAGPVGATLAGLLLRSLGAGAIVMVASCAFLGGRLMMSLGLPGPFSRFWIGAVVLVPTVAVLPPLLFNLAPETIPWVEPGWLGAEYGPVRVGGDYKIENILPPGGLDEVDYADREALRKFLSKKYENDRKSELASSLMRHLKEFAA